VLFSVWISAAGPWDDTLAVGRHAEATGWDGLWLADHFMNNGDGPNDAPNHEAFALLAGLAAAVPRVRIGSLVAGNTYRHPAVLAKTATTIDHISAAGWCSASAPAGRSTSTRPTASRWAPSGSGWPGSRRPAR
jgi:hypothetical protein